MRNKLVIIHGWADRADRGWFKWLREEMEKRGWDVIAPNLPDPKTPKREAWLTTLKELVGTPDENTYFVGHSMGCMATLRFLETFPESVTVGGAVFVSGSLRDREEVSDDPERLARFEEWNPTPLDYEKLRIQIPRVYAIFSDNDTFVPAVHHDRFKERLNAEIEVEHNRGHFSFMWDGITEMSKVRDKLLEWTS